MYSFHVWSIFNFLYLIMNVVFSTIDGFNTLYISSCNVRDIHSWHIISKFKLIVYHFQHIWLLNWWVIKIRNWMVHQSLASIVWRWFMKLYCVKLTKVFIHFSSYRMAQNLLFWNKSIKLHAWQLITNWCHHPIQPYLLEVGGLIWYSLLQCLIGQPVEKSHWW